MEAQEAAKKVSLGMNNLTLSELMEVYRALKDSDYAQELKLVSGYARGRVAVYGSSRRSSMSMDEINALYDLIETFGHNNAGELTAEGAKAKAFADKMAEKAKETAVDSVVRKLHDEEKKTPLTPAQKQVLDDHGFMYGETLESLGDFQDKDGALKVLRDEGVLTSVPEEARKETPKPTPLTREQVKVLDDLGIPHNGTVESLNWFREKEEAVKVLEEKGRELNEAQARKIKENKAEDIFVPDVPETELSATEVNKNMERLDMLSGSINPLDEQDERFADSRESLNLLDVRDDEGKVWDVREELVEMAKLQTEKDLHGVKKVTPELYAERLKFNIDTSVYAIISTDNIDFSKFNGDQNQMREALKTAIDKYAEPKGSKAHVKLDNVLGFLSVKSNELDAFADKLGQKFGQLPFVEKFKGKVRKFDRRAEKKFGPKVWGKIRGLGKIATKAAPDLGMAALAGFGGPAGLAIYGGYVFNKYAMPFIKKYTERPAEERTGFRKYIRENKKEALFAGLYTASAGLSIGMAAFQGITAVSAAAANAAAAGQSVDIAAKAALLNGYAGHAKAVVAGTNIVAKSAIKVYETHKAGDKKGVKRDIRNGILAAGMFAAGYALRSWLGAEHTGNSENQETTVSDTTVVDQNQNEDFWNQEQQDQMDWSEVVVYDDFYHGPEVAGKSYASIVSLLTNSETTREEAVLKAEMMIYRVGTMDEKILASFPDASHEQIAHAILLRAADVRKGDADQLLRALLGDGSCSKLTMEQTISEIHKGLTGYNYGQDSSLPFGRNLDPNYKLLNVRSRFRIEDCSSERLIDEVAQKTKVVPVPPQIELVDIPEDNTEIDEELEITDIRPAPMKTIPVESKVEQGTPDLIENKETVAPDQDEFVGRKLANYKNSQSGTKQFLNDIASGKIVKLSDGRYYEATPEEQAAFQRALQAKQGGR